MIMILLKPENGMGKEVKKRLQIDIKKKKNNLHTFFSLKKEY
jgi:hypothetical protein